jgi:hypothetical protein
MDVTYTDWLIESRHKVQRLMADLYNFSKQHPALAERENSDRLVYGHLVAIAFSLWRAAFLADKSRDWSDVFPNLEKALEKLITDNSFLYPDEKASGSWSVTYYLQNARLRIFYLTGERAPGLKQNVTYSQLLNAVKNDFDETGVRIWDNLMLITHLIFDHLKAQIR